MKIIKKALSIIFRIGISIALLVFLFRQVDVRVMFETVKKADKYFLLLALLIWSGPYILCLYRWQMLLKAAGINLNFKRVIISFAGGIFFSLFLPSSIGGDFMRSLDLAIFTRKPRQIVATVLLDRLSGYVGLVILTLLAVFFGWIREAITNLHQEIHYFRNHKKMLLNNIALSVFIQMFMPMSFYFIALAIGIKLSPVYFFIFLPIIGAITLLPVSIGGLGLRDAMTIFFFAKVGVAKDLAFAMSLLSFVFIVIYGSIGGIIYVFTIHHRRLQSSQPPAVCPNP